MNQFFQNKASILRLLSMNILCCTSGKNFTVDECFVVVCSR